MFSYTEIKKPTNLKEALQATGYLWWVEQRMGAVNAAGLNDPDYMLGLHRGLLHYVENKVQQGAVGARAILQPFCNAPAVTDYIRDYLGASEADTQELEPISDKELEAELTSAPKRKSKGN